MYDQIEISQIDNMSEYLPLVKKLGDENSKTLGFFPGGAFDESARRKFILVAIDSEGNFMGYLLYRIAKSRVMIVHLCVDEKHRGKDISKKLVNKLIDLTKDKYLGIGLNCRRDYEASKVWPKLNFYVGYEKPGRKKEGSTLNFWWHDFGAPTLFSEEAKDLINVVIDANVFFAFEEETKEALEAKALRADWLHEYIKIHITGELFNEIDRHKEISERKIWRVRARQFSMIQSDKDKADEIVSKLKMIIGNGNSDSDESDLRQLSYSITGKADVFVTCDRGILNSAEQILREYNIKILMPFELITDIDKVLNSIEYEPVRAGGTLLELTQVDSKIESELVSKFLNYSQSENRHGFELNLRNYFSDPKGFKVIGIKEPGLDIIGLVVFDQSDKYRSIIPLFRIAKGRFSLLLTKYLLEYVIQVSLENEKKLSLVADEYLQKETKEILRTRGFYRVSSGWEKYSCRGVLSCDTILQNIVNETCLVSEERNAVEKAITELHSTIKDDRGKLLKIEDMFYPVKILELDIPIYIIPIYPLWAMNLFDEHLASSDLFGAKPKLALNTENVYYRSSFPAKLCAPSRVLWYVSDDSNFPGSKKIRACSLISEVVIDKPKELFRKYQHLGVYEWKNVYEVAHGDIEKTLMAFRFQRTELFRRPIDLNLLREIMLESEKKNVNLQSPFEITSNSFNELYKIGTET